MSEALAPIIDREDAMLAELAELDLSLARHVHARALAAVDDAATSQLSLTYQRVSRSLRQTLALKAKLRRERGRDAAAFAESPLGEAEEKARVARRVRELDKAVARVIWSEYETERPDPDEDSAAELMTQSFWEVVRETRGDPTFGRQPLDEHLAEIAEILDLPQEAVARWRDLPPPHYPDYDDDEDDGFVPPHARRSSA